jgi:hypothetical protein
MLWHREGRVAIIAHPTPPVPTFLGRSSSSEERAVTPAYKRNLGLIFIIINVGYLLFALFTGRMEGLGSLPDLFTNLHDVPTTLAGKSFAFVFVAHAAIAVMGVKLLREALKEGA